MFAALKKRSPLEQAAYEIELAVREEARERVRNTSSPVWEDLCRAISPVSPQIFSEGVEDFSPPASGRASVDLVALYNATAKAEVHYAQSLERIEELEGELKAARRQVQALQWSRGLHSNRLHELEELHKQHEKNKTRMIREAERMHEVLPLALETHRSKIRVLHPEEEEELLLHFLQKGNVISTFIEITGHGEGVVRVTTDRDEILFAPMRSGKRKRFNLNRPDKMWRGDHPWIRLTMGALHIVNYGRYGPLSEHFSEFLQRNLAGITEVNPENFCHDSLRESCKKRGKEFKYSRGSIDGTHFFPRCIYSSNSSCKKNI